MTEETGIERYFREQTEQEYAKVLNKFFEAKQALWDFTGHVQNTYFYDSSFQPPVDYRPGQIVLQPTERLSV